MGKIFILLTLSFVLICFASAQSVLVNPDETHSTVINNGSTSTIVNPDGTHSTVINTGSTSTIVNPDGTHSAVINNGKTSTIVNPDGTHSTVINKSKSTIVNPDGTQPTVIANDTTSPVKVRVSRRNTASDHLISELHTLSIHVRDTITHDSVFHFLAEKLKLPVYYFPLLYGARKYAGVYAGNLVLEPCGPYSNFSYASDNFRAIFFGLTFEPFSSISSSAKGLLDRGIPHEKGDSYIYIKDPVLCGDNITISFGLGKTEDKRVRDSLLRVMIKDTDNGPGIEYVKEIRIGYKDNLNFQKWKALISPDKLVNKKTWIESDILEFHLAKDKIKEVQGITFKVRSLEVAKQYLVKNNLFGGNLDNLIVLNNKLTFGLQIYMTE